MKYMGSKARVAKHILPFILNNRHSNQVYVEPFCGGCNLIDRVDGQRIAADCNPFLIAMFKELTKGWNPPFVTKELYREIRENKESFPDFLVGWVGFNCSYSGKFFGGYAGVTKTKNGSLRDYQREAIANVSKQIQQLKGVEFVCATYQDLQLPAESIVYCDIPYKGTTGYADSFDHDSFYSWCLLLGKAGHQVFISEYEMPAQFNCIWSGEVASSLSANGKSGGNKVSTEKLFTIRA